MYKFVPFSSLFPFKEAKALFDNYKNIFEKQNISSFGYLLSITENFLYAVYANDVFSGVIFFTDWEKGKENKYVSCELGGFAKKGNAQNSIKAILGITDYIFKAYKIEKIYSKTYEKAAKICLLKSGFKKVDNRSDCYVLER